jgi:hypothetical protein
MEGGLFNFFMSLKETMNYAHKDQVLPKDQVILGIIALDSKSYLMWKLARCQKEVKEKSS